MSNATVPLPGGPLPLTMRQSAVAAIVLLVVGLGAALETRSRPRSRHGASTHPAASRPARPSSCPPGLGGAGPRDERRAAVARGGAAAGQLAARRPADPQTALSQVAAATQQVVPDARGFGRVGQFSTPSGDSGYVEPFAAAGTTGAIAVVKSEAGEAVVKATAPSTTFASVSDDLQSMIASIRIQRGRSS